jgi:hypothetical protein
MKEYSGIDYAFRPQSYWDDLDPLSAILKNVTGENRRRMITDYWNAGRLEELDPKILQSEPDEDTRDRLGRIHPSFLGGEFLPGYRFGEVEIARICLQSTTSDVISIRARPLSEGIAYRVEDEYETVFKLGPPQTQRPLSLTELIETIDGGSIQDWDSTVGLALVYNEMNAQSTDFENLRQFTRISSCAYRQLDAHYENVFEEWVTASCRKRDLEIHGEEGQGQ